MNATNLFRDIPTPLPEELIQVLQEAPGVRIERILSQGHASPPGFWYDQDRDEWVVLLHGHARLRFDDAPLLLEMKPGDHIHIPAHRRHRVEWTDPNQVCIWLAVHFLNLPNEEES